MQLHIKPKQPFYSPLTLPRRLAYLENRSVNPAYILGISLWLGDLDRHPNSGLFGESGNSRP